MSDNVMAMAHLSGLEIAIIGMTARFPGAADIDTFWHNLREGKETITSFTDEELESEGVSPTLLNNPNYVKAAPILEGIDLFDASFFGYTPQEAEIMEPQQRLFLEGAWHALEHAGYAPESYEGAIGVYAGSRMNTYVFNLYSNRKLIEKLGLFHVGAGNDFAFLGPRVSYKLDLTGPSYSLHTACSTSLVVVHLACQSLLNYECDMALAGGVSIYVPHRVGYVAGGILSPDGRCRTFDAKAQGTIFGSGMGIVVLKRLEDALADRDCIHAVIKGTATNNDGSVKSSFTAPSVDGQTAVILEALGNAETDPETISYVEAHGSGTPLGDPIEVRALTKAFRVKTDKSGFCGIGSVKSNVGHLEAAAGVAGLIKTVLALKHKEIPPTLHFEQPNPEIDFASSPFYVNHTLSEWQTKDMPRRAGVSSFGMGGTNAHVVLQEAPPVEENGPSRPWQLLVLSAKTAPALEAMTANLASHLKQHPTQKLADVAYTLHVGRSAFDHRRMVVGQDTASAITALETGEGGEVATAVSEAVARPVVFMFAGGGAQYVNMGAGLYQSEPRFRESLDRCAELLIPHLGYDLRELLYPPQESAALAQRMQETSVALPALFAVEYALAQVWLSWGIQPQAMIGHSLGEYVAACLAGVFSLADGLALVVLRGQLFEQLAEGAMLSVPLPEAEVGALMDEALSLAAVNGPAHCVVSGEVAAIDRFGQQLVERDLEFRRLKIDVAAHSEMVVPILEPFRRHVETLSLQAPQIPYLSNVTGTWITAAEATDPTYWTRHLRQTVRFADGLAVLLQEPGRILLEVGPGQTLRTLAGLQANSEQAQAVLSSMRHPYDPQADEAFLLATLGKLWLNGVAVAWPQFYGHEQRRRVPLPGYPFQRQRYWIEPGEPGVGSAMEATGKKTDIAQWFYIPSWRRSLPPPPFPPGDLTETASRWLVFVDEQGVGTALAARLAQAGQKVVRVEMGTDFGCREAGVYTLNPARREEYGALVAALHAQGETPQVIVHLWSLDQEERLDPNGEAPATQQRFAAAQTRGYYSLLYLLHALQDAELATPLRGGEAIRLEIISNHLHRVAYGETVHPEKMTLMGPCLVIPQEYPNVTCHCIDVALAHSHDEVAGRLLAEISANTADLVVAYRGDQRWVQTYETVALAEERAPARALRPEGVYLITGGLGGVGLLLARYLARTVQARLVLLGRSRLPAREAWPQWLASHDEADPTSRKIRQVQALAELGAEVLLVSADVADEQRMDEVVAEIDERFGALHGVLHAAGITKGESIYRPVREIGREASELQFQPKVYGTYVLAKVLAGKALDFCLLFSSNAAVLGGLGFVAYAAANLFLNAFAANGEQESGPWIAANWDGWLLEEGGRRLNETLQTSLDQFAMTPEESVEAFRRVATLATVNEVIVSPGELESRYQVWVKGKFAPGDGQGEGVVRPRPALQDSYVAPRNEVERRIAAVWQELLGFEQVGIEDSFFDLGGHSLLATQLVSRLRDMFYVELPLRSLFEQPTVAGVADLIAGALATQIDSSALTAVEQMPAEEVETLLGEASP